MFHNLCKDFSLAHIYVFAKAEEQLNHHFPKQRILTWDLTRVQSVDAYSTIHSAAQY